MAYGKSQLTNPEIARLELLPPEKEVADMLKHAMRQLKRVANLCVRSWLSYHDRHNTLLKMESGWPVHPCPPELCARWLREAQALCPDTHCATVLAVTNWLAQTITAQKSPLANEKRWRRVLRYDESHWSFQHPLPVRLWNGNAKVERIDGGLAIVVRVDRIDTGAKRATSTPIENGILRPKQSNRTAGHRLAYLAACEIADDTRKLAQSQLTFERGKWYLMLTVNGPEPSKTSARRATKTLVVRPGRQAALRIKANTITGEIADDALDRVSRVRAQLDGRRESWRKEHGDRPLPRNVAEQLSSTWRRQSSAICDTIAAEVMRALRDRDFGRVLWLDGNNRTAALALAGRSGDNDRRELFPFEQLRRKIEKRLGEMGIEVVGRANFRSPKRRQVEHRKRERRGAAQTAGAAREHVGAKT